MREWTGLPFVSTLLRTLLVMKSILATNGELWARSAPRSDRLRRARNPPPARWALRLAPQSVVTRYRRETVGAYCDRVTMSMNVSCQAPVSCCKFRVLRFSSTIKPACRTLLAEILLPHSLMPALQAMSCKCTTARLDCGRPIAKH